MRTPRAPQPVRLGCRRQTTTSHESTRPNLPGTTCRRFVCCRADRPTVHAVLLTDTYEAQIEGWLGLGDVTFSTIYNQAGAGMSNAGFHAAADGQGATITLLSVGAYYDSVYNTPSQIIGGYNPQSWNSSSDYNYTYTDAERTAFLFNLTDDVVQRQNLIGEGDSGTGQYQTYNSPGFGPTFGGGHDIYSNLIGTLSYGYAHNWSYGGTSLVQSITSGATDGASTYDQLRISEIEVLTFTRVPDSGGGSTVPDAGSTLSLLGLSLLGLAGARRLKGAAA